MAYAALISLKLTIERQLNFSRGDPQIVCLYENVCLLQQHFEGISCLESSTRRRETLFANLEKQIREATSKLEDALESHISNKSESLGDESQILTPSSDFQEVQHEINFYKETVNKILEEYRQLSNSLQQQELQEEEEEDDADDDEMSKLKGIVRSRIDYFSGKTKLILDHFGGKTKSKIVTLYDEMRKLKGMLLQDACYLGDTTKVVSMVGMVGIGKTTLAKQVYEDPSVKDRFQCRAWVTIGQKYQLRKIMLDILDQIPEPERYRRPKSDNELAEYVYRSLEDKRYLIVLDDVWSTRVWDELKMLFPEGVRSLQWLRSSRIVLTTRLGEIATHAISLNGNEYYHNREGYNLKLRFLNEEESWNLFCDVFAEDLCPPELEKVAKKIVNNCEGLPLAIIEVGTHLRKAERTLEYWEKVAKKKIPVFNKSNDVIFSSYKYLPQNLKACFLYMGVFPHDYEVPASKLIKLWSSEGFLESNPTKTLEDIAMEYLEGLVSRSLILVRKRTSNGGIKTCNIHYVFQHICITEAGKDKFLHVLETLGDSLTEAIKNQRRLCIHNNVLFGIKDAYDSMASISRTTRSLLCTGPRHQYPVPMCFGLRLLRVLDAFTIRFYTFPMEIIKLVQLRYLAFTYDGELHADISKLKNLQYLIVRRHLNIVSCADYLPWEIWHMQELRHLQVMGSSLPDHPFGLTLPNLLTLLDVSAHSCTEEVLGAMPDLKKLGVQIDLSAAEPSSFLDDLVHIHGLESLKCVFVNSEPLSQAVPPPASTKVLFPLGLKSLTLSGFGYPWEYMNEVAALPKLEVLKLRGYAFQGSEWKIYKHSFLALKFLLIEDTDLMHWRAEPGSLPCLENLIFRHCYKLENIPELIKPWDSRKHLKLQLVDTNPSVLASAKESLRHFGSPFKHKLQVRVHSSWEDGRKLKS